MFNYIVDKLQEVLGEKFKVFNMFAPQVYENTKLLDAGYNIAVLNPDSGSIRPLKGIQGLEADCTIDILMRVEKEQDGKFDTARFEKVLYDLIENSNGEIYTQSADDP